MATISARIDDQLKSRAEEIADSIGIPLSSVISIFLRRFIAERGFPFEVKAFEEAIPAQHYDTSALETAVKRATLNPDCPVPPDHFTYFDPKTQRPVTVYNRKEP